MLLRRFAPLAAVLALAAPIVSGCGAEDAAGVDIAEAASATAKKGTANYTMTMAAEGMGLPRKLDLKMSGVTSLTKPQMTIRLDAGPILSAVGVPLPGAILDMKLDGGDLYVKPPAVPGMTIPGGKEWVSLDLGRAAEAFGIDATGLAPLFSYDPAAYLRLVDTAKGLKEVGTEAVNGTETRHFRGTYSLNDTIDALPRAKRDAARKALEGANDKLGLGDKLLDEQTPVDLWIDDAGVVRRMSSRQSLPAQQGMPAGKFSFTYDLTKFGTKLDVTRPGSVFDATDPLVKGLKEFANLGAGAPKLG